MKLFTPFASHVRTAVANRGQNQEPDDIKMLLAAADRALAAGATELAAETYQRAVAMEPGSTDALHGLAACMTLQEQWQKALGVYAQLLELHPDDQTAAFNRALLLIQLNRFGQAEAALNGLLKRDPSYFRARYNLASLYQAQGKLTQAREAYEQLLSPAATDATSRPAMADADAATAWQGYGLVLMDMHDYEPAVKAFATAAKLQESFDSWLNMGLAACGCGKYGHATLAAQKADKLAASDAKALKSVGLLWLDVHRGTEKREFLANAVGDWKASLALDAKQDDVRKLIATYEAMLK